MAEVRSEFRSDVLEFAPEDAVFGGTACRVMGCGRTARGGGLCQGHLQRWNNQGHPDLQRFIGSTDPRWPRQQPNQHCRVLGCGYGSARGRRPGRGRRLGSRVPARCLADAPTRLRRRPHTAIRRIPQPWLRDLIERWVRWRLSTGLCRETGGGRPVVVITRFAGFLADIGVERIDQIDRSVLKRYLADLRGDSVGTQWRSAHLGLLNRFFAAIRQHRWDTALPADAMFCTEDHPKRAERLPRALAEHVMAQLEHPDNLARFDDPALQNPSENPSDLRTQANLRLGKARGTAQSAGPW
jgi:hypothetical protein